jgi:hypothetical protein
VRSRLVRVPRDKICEGLGVAPDSRPDAIPRICLPLRCGSGRCRLLGKYRLGAHDLHRDSRFGRLIRISCHTDRLLVHNSYLVFNVARQGGIRGDSQSAHAITLSAHERVLTDSSIPALVRGQTLQRPINAPRSSSSRDPSSFRGQPPPTPCSGHEPQTWASRARWRDEKEELAAVLVEVKHETPEFRSTS